MKSTLLFRLLVVAASALAISPFCSAQANLAGDWQGTLDVNGTTYHVAWHVQVGSGGVLTSTLDNIDENVYGIKVKSTTVKGSDISMSVDDQVEANGQTINIRGSFAGTIAASGNEVNGTWTQEEPEQPPIQVHFVHGQPAVPGASATPSIAGDWEGTLNAGGAQLRLLLHFKAGNDGTLSATLDSPDQGVNGTPFDTVTLKDSKLHLVLEAAHGTYDGTVNKDFSEIAGTWTQGQAFDLNFKRARPQAAAPAPKPAAPTDIDGTWSGRLETPSGALTINLKIENMDTGLTAHIQSPDQNPNWAPATSIARTGDNLTVEFKAFGATYEGKISADRTTIEGKFNQMGNELPLVLKKL